MDRYRTNRCLNRASAGSTQSLSRPIVGLKIRSRAAIYKYVDKVHVIGAASGTRFIFKAQPMLCELAMQPEHRLNFCCVASCNLTDALIGESLV